MNKILILFLSLLPCAAVFCQDSLPVIPDEEYRLACGPIAGLIALESLGVATDLPEIASRCHSLSLRRRAMNSKYFLFAAVFVILSFFAICFVWEMRSALPVDTQRDISVGACNTLRTSSLLPDACSATPEVSCETSFFYQTIHFDCGCKQTFVLISGCVRPYSESACTAKDGHLASLSEEGIYVDDTKIGNCGGKNGYYCETAYPGQNITLSHDFDPECPHGSCSKKISIYPCHQTDDQVPNLDCGTKREIKIGC